MKFSVKWLQEWLGSLVDVQDLVDTYTMSGLEVESMEPAAAEFQGVIVGQVLSEAMHPDSQRLHCCQVDIGQNQPLQIVCGASNVRAGLKVAVATIGAQLPGGIEIKSTILRGQPSQGMICSARELRLDDDKEAGIIELPADAPVGVDLRDYLLLNDQIIDLALTANRGDCLSISGLARETAALLNISVKPEPTALVTATIADTLQVSLEAPAACPRYCGRLLRQINSKATTPIWMQERLRRSGIRSIHPVVDVTNYVMLELGQPLHAFNLANIDGEIHVRLAKSGETLNLLDGKSLQLDVETLVIADHQQPLALAGIMGGAASGVSVNTTDLFIESAFFSSIPMSLTARRYGLQTDSSYRYARGVDYNLPRKALERATQLLIDIVGGQPGPIIELIEPDYLPKPQEIILRRDQIKRLLGIELPDSQVVTILESLGLRVFKEIPGWRVQVPSYRNDLSIEVDLIEELARINGYHRILPQPMMVKMQIPKHSAGEIPLSRIRALLIDRGYHEAITYSFVDPRDQQWLDPDHQAIALANPLSSEMGVMRTNLWPGLLTVLKYNQNRQIPRVRLFETGLCFLPTDPEWQQIPMLGGVVSGNAHPEQWGVPSRPIDFFDVKADIELLLGLTGQGQVFSWRRSQHPILHPGQSAALFLGEQEVGQLGALHPETAKLCDVANIIYLFQFKLDLISMRQPNEFKAISKYPAVRRDLALTVSQTIASMQIQQYIQEKAGKLLNNVQIFDVYQGQNIEKSQKSIALGLIFQDATRTLKDTEIQTIVDDLINGLAHEFNAKLRV